MITYICFDPTTGGECGHEHRRIGEAACCARTEHFAYVVGGHADDEAQWWVLDGNRLTSNAHDTGEELVHYVHFPKER